MHRRSFLGLLGITFGAPPRAADREKVFRIGYLHPTDPRDFACVAFRRAVSESRQAAAGNWVVDECFAEGRFEWLSPLAAELVARRAEVIVAVSPLAIRAARMVTTTIPIVMAFCGVDPVKAGFAATLARPGGNITGLTLQTDDVSPKQLELLSALVPTLKTVAVLTPEPARPGHITAVDLRMRFSISVAAKCAFARCTSSMAATACRYAK